MLCLDDSGILASTIRGEHVPLIEPYGPANDLPFTRPIVVTANVAGLAKTHLLLRLDSGSNAAMLHVADPKMRVMINRATPTLKRVVEGVDQVFAVLPGQNLEIGKQQYHEVSFVVPVNSTGDGPTPREDGVLPTVAFQRVFISATARYAAFEPW